jgi:hypothetical protein
MTSQSESATAFGAQLFGQAGWHGGTAKRWVKMAASLLLHPTPFVTSGMRTEAEQTGAFRQLHSARVSPEQVVEAVGDSTARMVANESMVIVPIDGSSVAVRDPDGRKGAGSQSTRAMTMMGFKVMTAIAVTLTGVAIGVIGLHWWTRPRLVRKRTAKQKKQDRISKSVMQKESGHWFRQLNAIVERLQRLAPQCRAWFQMDRGADIAELLLHIVQHNLLATVRLAHERRGVGAEHRTQIECVKAAKPIGVYTLTVPAGRVRAERSARMVVRASEITIPVPRSKHVVTINVVHTREVGTAPRGEKPIEWFLYTTAAISTMKQCCAAIDAYAKRWSIEEFHNAWKSGGTHVERTQLRSKNAILKWATLLAAVSIRAIRLAKLARETPDVPATTEFSAHEITAAILLKKPKGVGLDHQPNMAQMVRWVADLGGYAGSRAKYPPGKIVILRGLLDVEAAARALEQQDRMKKVTNR